MASTAVRRRRRGCRRAAARQSGRPSPARSGAGRTTPTDSSAYARAGISGSSAMRARAAPVEQRVVRERRAGSWECRAPTARAAHAGGRRGATKAVRGRRVDISRADEAELFAQLQRRRLLHQHRIGAGVDREAVDVLGVNQPAGRGPASSSTNGTCRCVSSYAAARPVMPAPMMTITSVPVSRTTERCD